MLLCTADLAEKPSNLAPEGFNSHEMTAILATNVIHATMHLASTMATIHVLLQPGGHIVFNEVQNPGTLPEDRNHTLSSCGKLKKFAWVSLRKGFGAEYALWYDWYATFTCLMYLYYLLYVIICEIDIFELQDVGRQWKKLMVRTLRLELK